MRFEIRPGGQMSDLDEITSRLGKAYDQWKEGEKAKDKHKGEFFTSATERLREAQPEQRVEIIEADSKEQALRIAQRRYHKHSLIDIQETEDKKWKIALEENPNLQPFSHINREDGRVYSRSVVEGSPLLDDEAIQEENPELWDRITREVSKREMRPLEELSEDDLMAIQPYLYMPKPTVKLPAPRRARPEELDDHEDND